MLRHKMPRWLAIACLSLLTCMNIEAQAAPVQSGSPAESLRCEYLVDPLGIDVERPRLSWMLPPGERGRKQSAYQVLVASSPAILAKDRGDRWDSGRVDSEQSVFVPYGGRPLASGDACTWKVRVWDNAGLRS